MWRRRHLALAAGTTREVFRQKLKRVKSALLFPAGCRKQAERMIAVVRKRTAAKDGRGNRTLPAPWRKQERAHRAPPLFAFGFLPLRAALPLAAGVFFTDFFGDSTPKTLTACLR